jgi:hypothetical protein
LRSKVYLQYWGAFFRTFNLFWRNTVRRTFALLGLMVGITTSAQAQRAWQSEVGIQGGYSRLVNAGTGAGPTDVIGLPGFALGPAAPFTPAIFAVLPWKEKIGIELGFSAAQLQGATSATVAEADVRGNYALTNNVYLGVGGAVGYINNNGITETQLGVQGGLGYRRHLTGPLQGRVEFRTMFWGKTENVAARNIYSVLFGVSARTRAAATPRRTTRAATNRAWTPQFGVAAGYANIHPVGGAAPNITALAFPGFGAALSAFGSPPYSLPPTLFVIVPVGTKIALEPGLDLHRQQSGGTTVFSGNLGARLNYAVHGGWYGAVGGTLNYLKSGSQSGSRIGLNTALGYRFPFSNALGGRIELNYTMFGDNTDLGVPPVNVMGLMVGVMVPLK